MRFTALWQYDCVKCFKNMRIHQNQKTRSLISTNLKILSNLTQNLNLIDMRKNGHFFNQKWISVSKVCGVFLIAKSVSLLWWGTDFHLWKPFQSRLRLNDWETHWTPLITLFRKYVARRKKQTLCSPSLNKGLLLKVWDSFERKVIVIKHYWSNRLEKILKEESTQQIYVVSTVFE